MNFFLKKNRVLLKIQKKTSWKNFKLINNLRDLLKKVLMRNILRDIKKKLIESTKVIYTKQKIKKPII